MNIAFFINIVPERRSHWMLLFVLEGKTHVHLFITTKTQKERILSFMLSASIQNIVKYASLYHKPISLILIFDRMS
jgi:hypothetical protein